ncbi:MAG TPA: DUF4177 domain-containing protein [Thermodesulfobacteriota bacterium]|nr:DUF4177 domain-containing protein [Thermodesulfobacteriota bacterium]
MPWEYKVVSIESLIPDDGDHDIAVSKQDAQNRKEKLSNNMQDSLNNLGNDGWELVSIFSDFGIFKKLAN